MRRWAVLTAETVVLLVYVTGRPGALSDVVTLAGHLFALHLGMLAWQPWLRRRGLVGSVRFRRRELAPPLEGLAEPVPTA